jgi:PAS domain S-box-containing protein
MTWAVCSNPTDFYENEVSIIFIQRFNTTVYPFIVHGSGRCSTKQRRPAWSCGGASQKLKYDRHSKRNTVDRKLAMTRTPSEFTGAAVASPGGDRHRAINSAEDSSRAYYEAQKELDLLCRTLHAMPGHFAIFDARAEGAPIVFVNVALARDYGYEDVELIGHPFFALFASTDDGPQRIERIKQELSAAGETRAEFQAVRRDGSTFTTGMVFAPVKNERGLSTHVGCSARDITAIIEEQRDKRALQEQLYAEMRERERIAIELRLAQKLESVGRLAAGVAHEINTPIQYVGDSVHFLKSAVADLQQLTEVYRGALEALFRGESPEIVRANLTQIDILVDKQFIDVEIPQAFARTLEGVERVTSIVRAMKEFAHPDAQEQGSADINHAIETTLLVARNEYKYHARVEAELGELPAVVCNVNELNQVFLNLIINATHAIESAGRDPSSGRIQIRTSGDAGSVEIVIEDNGCGIPKENFDRIFDPFFTTKEIGKGTGQGLAIVRSIIVEKHAGTITVDSQVGKGTRIILRLPTAGRKGSPGK